MSLNASPAAVAAPVRYLTFQIFTGSFSSGQLRASIPSPNADLRATVANLRERIGAVAAPGRQTGFIVGPIAFDDTDRQVRELIASGFAVAQQTGVAVGFHVDDSMFWGRLSALNTHQNLEWLDWRGTPNTGRRLDWSSTPLKIMPQLCFNSHGVRAAVKDRAKLIGSEIAKGVATLRTRHQEALFAGVIAGWETQIGRDFDSGKPLGYCALTNAGYRAAKPPADLDAARARIVSEFIGFWANELAAAGVPKGKLYSHVAIGVTPPSVAFCSRCIPGLSTYPDPGLLERWRAELNARGNPPWASSEGSPLDPAQAERSGRATNAESYLGNLFNHGAVLVNVFGWGVGQADNSFRRAAESADALAAYRRFLRSEKLSEAPVAFPNRPPVGLEEKVHLVQARLPGWLAKHGPALVRDDATRLDIALREHRFQDAEKAADAILHTIGAR